MGDAWYGAIQAAATPVPAVVYFDVPGATDLSPIPGSYQPVSGVTMGYPQANIVLSGVDHTPTGPNSQSYWVDGDAITITFDVDVSLPDMWVSTWNNIPASVIVATIYDASDNVIASSGNIPIPDHAAGGQTNAWVEYTGFTATNVRKLTVFGSNAPQLDDLTVVVAAAPVPAMGTAGLLTLASLLLGVAAGALRRLPDFESRPRKGPRSAGGGPSGGLPSQVVGDCLSSESIRSVKMGFSSGPTPPPSIYTYR